MKSQLNKNSPHRQDGARIGCVTELFGIALIQLAFCKKAFIL